MINHNNRKVTWEEIGGENWKVRICPISFKLKDNVFICGGVRSTRYLRRGIHKKSLLMCCDMFNLKNNTYNKCPFRLPYPLYRNGITFVATDTKENFAIIVGRNDKIDKGGIIIFTEKEGFREISGNSDAEFRKRILFRLT